MTLTVVAPSRSRDQRLEALVRANAIRFKRAEMKRQLITGQMSALELLADPPEWLRGMHVYGLLVAIPKWGPTKARHLLNECRISHAKTVGGLSDRQRGELVNVLRWRLG